MIKEATTPDTYFYQKRNVKPAAMTSIYAVLGYPNELYVNDGGMLVFPLYREHEEPLKELLGKPVLERRFVAMENLRNLPASRIQGVIGRRPQPLL